MASSKSIHPTTNPSSKPIVTSSNVDKIHLSRRVQHAITGIVLLIISYLLPPYPVGFSLLTLATAAFYHVHRKRIHDESWDKWYLEQFGALLRNHERGEWENNHNLLRGGSNNINDNSTSLNNKNKNTTSDKNNHDSSTTYKRRRKAIPALPGAFYFLLGTSLSTLLFPTDVARASLLVLSIADPMAGLVGGWFSEKGCNITWKQLFAKLQRIFRRKDNNKRSVDAAAEKGGPSIAGSIACAASTILCTHVYIPSSVGIIDARMGSVPYMNISLQSRIFVGILTSLTEAIAGRKLPMIGKVADDNLLIPLVVGGLICWLSE